MNFFKDPFIRAAIDWIWLGRAENRSRPAERDEMQSAWLTFIRHSSGQRVGRLDLSSRFSLSFFPLYKYLSTSAYSPLVWFFWFLLSLPVYFICCSCPKNIVFIRFVFWFLLCRLMVEKEMTCFSDGPFGVISERPVGWETRCVFLQSKDSLSVQRMKTVCVVRSKGQEQSKNRHRVETQGEIYIYISFFKIK